MEDNNIRKYATLMRELGLTGLEISENGSVVRLERNEQGHSASSQEQITPVAAVAQSPVDNDVAICSPLVGVFYAAATEDGQPFVKVGDSVRRGDVICIIEAMKLMNEITAEQDGVIAEVCAVNNQIVDYGHVLFRLKKE